MHPNRNDHKRIPTFVVDSFTNVPFEGNPAGVCRPEYALDDQLMQSIARELNLSETAFVFEGDQEDVYSIRYFSPKMEIPLCGHATLASAKILFESTEMDRLTFTTIEGLRLEVVRRDKKIEMLFPVYDLVAAVVPKAMLSALGIESILYCGFNKEMKILMLEIEDADELARISPDFVALKKSHDGINGVLITSAAPADGFDFHSRYFWPWSGTDEDPVTGGTHTFLAKYWSQRLGKSRMRSFQSSARTGELDVELTDDGKLLIRGSAVIVLEGALKH